jgi:quinoprotein glucose dehydrogenase
MLGHAKLPESAAPLFAALADPAPRVRFFASLALARLRGPEAVPALLALLRDQTGDDAFIRHGAVMGLAGCGDLPVLLAAADDASANVRAGVLLALRRQGRVEIARFLRDPSEQLVLEAARAIYDEPIEPALPQLAVLTAQPDLAPPVLRRAINANYFLGDSASADRLAMFADSGAPEALRADAVEALGQWNQALGSDRFLGKWRPLPVTRDSRAAPSALTRVVSRLLARQAGELVRIATVNAVAALEVREAEGSLVSIMGDDQAGGALRSAALVALAEMSSERVEELLKRALADPDPVLRAKAVDLAARRDPGTALKVASNTLKWGTLPERQNALRTLAAIDGKEADKQIRKWLERHLAGEVPPALHLDLLEAAAQRSGAEVKEKIAEIDSARSPGRLGPWRECLVGGDAVRGREIFCEKAEAGCLRCHKVRGLGGDVGPDLSTIGARLDRVSLLKAILFPNDTISPGWENAVLSLKDGRQLVGVVSPEKEGRLILRPLTGGKPVELRSDDIAERSRLPSPMPEGLGAVLGKRDLRDVIEFLAGLK